MLIAIITIFHDVHTVYSKCIDGVMVRVLASSEVDRVFEARSGQIKDYKSGICCFSTKHAVGSESG